MEKKIIILYMFVLAELALILGLFFIVWGLSQTTNQFPIYVLDFQMNMPFPG